MRAVYEPFSETICHRFYDNSGCTFCYFNGLERCVSKTPLTIKEKINHFNKWAVKNMKKIEKEKGILIASCGSFFPQQPLQLREHIYEFIEKNPKLDLAFEIRATMYNPKRARQEFEAISNKINVEMFMQEIERGIKELRPNHIPFLGLEVANNEDLEILNKGCFLKDYEYATEFIHNSGARVGVNILINPPEIKNPIMKALETAKYTVEILKIDEMHLFGCLPGKPSKAYQLWKEGKWNPSTATEASEISRQIREKYSPFPNYISIVRNQWFTGRHGKYKLKNRKRTIQQKQKERNMVKRIAEEMNF